MQLEVNTVDALPAAAQQVLEFAGNSRIFLLEGDMGSGKTTLTKEMCRALGSADNFSSPTYSIVNEYLYPGGKIFHFDLYRLKNLAELLDIGFEDYLYSGHYCFIEWPALAADLFPEGAIKIVLTVTDTVRHIAVTRL